MFKHKRIILIFILVSIASIVYLVYQSKSTQKEPSGGFLPEIKTPDIVLPTLAFVLPESFSLEIPSELNLYEISRNSLDTNQAGSVAESFGFTSKPQVINDPVYGTTYLLTNGNSALTIKFQSRIITYYSGIDFDVSKIGFNANENEISQQALAFLEKTNGLSPLKLQPAQIVFLRSYSEEAVVASTQSQANLAKVHVSALLDNLPIIGSAALLSPNSEISYNNQLQVLSANITLPPLQFQTGERKKTVSLQEFKKNIFQSKLISFDNPSTLDSASDLFTGEISVKKVYLAYYQYSGQQTMQPVFVIEGSGKTKSGASASGTFILPATTSNQP